MTIQQLQRRPGYLGGVTYQAYVNGIPYNNRPPILDAQLTQTFGMHDQFTLRIEFPVNFPVDRMTIWPDNTPIQVQWGQAPDLNLWYGYVNHHAIASNADSGSKLVQLTYTCIGTSSVLNSVVTQKWEQVSATYIAKSIAASNGFRSVTNPNGIVIPFVQQAAQSDFQFLNQVANDAGMRFWCSGGTLYMISPTTMLEGGGQGAVPTFYMDKSLVYQDTLRNFTYTQGTNLPGSVQTNRAVYGIDAATSQPFSAAAQPVSGGSRVSVSTGTPATNYTDAQNQVNAQAALSQFWIGAQATLLGNTHLYPGKLVQLTGVQLPSNGPGFWLVSSATHSLSSSQTGAASLDKYLVDVVLLKNNASSSVTLTNVTPVLPEIIPMQANLSGSWVATQLNAVSVPS